MKELYMIRRRSDGLCSNGKGCHPKFVVGGKVWHDIGNLKNHVNSLALDPHTNTVYDDCDLITVEITEKTAEPMKSLVAEQAERVKYLFEKDRLVRLERAAFYSLRQGSE